MSQGALAAQEAAGLHVSLDRHSDARRWEIDGLADEQLGRPMPPSGTNMLGLVTHPATVEYWYFCTTFGRKAEQFWFGPYTEDMQVATHESTEVIVEFSARARTAADGGNQRALSRHPRDILERKNRLPGLNAPARGFRTAGTSGARRALAALPGMSTCGGMATPFVG